MILTKDPQAVCLALYIAGQLQDITIQEAESLESLPLNVLQMISAKFDCVETVVEKIKEDVLNARNDLEDVAAKIEHYGKG